MEQTLEKLGLSDKAVKAYLASLQLGTAGMTALAKTAGLKRPTTYLAVDELLIRGFLSASYKGKRALYTPEHPRRFLQVLRSRERELEQLLPELEALYEGPKEKPRVRMYEGKESMMRLYEETFQKLADRRSELLFFSAIDDLDSNIPETLQEYYKLISVRNYRIREIVVTENKKTNSYINKVNKLRGPHHHIRLLDPKRFHFSNTDNIIFEDKVMFFSLKKAVYVVLIEDVQIADALRALYNAAWEQGEEVPR
jgi:sugar-specific transcriptional regulator TrmB